MHCGHPCTVRLVNARSADFVSARPAAGFLRCDGERPARRKFGAGKSQEPPLCGGYGQGRRARLEGARAVRRHRTGFARRRETGRVRANRIRQHCQNYRRLRLRSRLGSYRPAPDFRLDDLPDIVGRRGCGRRVQDRYAIGRTGCGATKPATGCHEQLANERCRNQPEASGTCLPSGNPMRW
jgi:hypothetical protein